MAIDVKESAVAWFAVFWRARKDEDHRRAADALDQLRRLGVTIRFQVSKHDRRRKRA